MNLTSFLGNTAEDLNFYFSLAYVLVWLLFMFTGMKTKSKAFSNVYLIFWTLSVIYFTIYTFWLDSDLGYVVLIALPIFLLPLMGFYFVYEILLNALKFDFLYSAVLAPFITVSLIMLLAGIAARIRRRKKTLL